jgi:hypothetical protein
VQHPCRFDIGRLIKTLGSVAMRCYSHLSDDEREQTGLASFRPRRDCASDRPSEIDAKLPSGRYSPLHAAGAYQLRRRREALIERDRTLRTFVVDRLAEGWTPKQISGWLKGGNERRLRAVGCDDLCFHLSGSPKGRAVVALSHPSSQTPPATPIETFTRYHQGSHLHPRTAQDCRRQNRGRPLGG